MTLCRLRLSAQANRLTQPVSRLGYDTFAFPRGYQQGDTAHLVLRGRAFREKKTMVNIGDEEKVEDEMKYMETIRPSTSILARPQLSVTQESIGASGDAKHSHVLCTFSSRAQCDR